VSRPSDRAIAQAFWEMPLHDKGAIGWAADVGTRAREIDAAAPEGAQEINYDLRTSAGLNNACAKMQMKEGQGASDALYELAVKHGAPGAVAAGFAHTVNNAMIALHEQALERTTTPPQPQDAARDREDAERYRWLRDKAISGTRHDPAVLKDGPTDLCEFMFGDELDAAIDAARGAGGGGN